MGPERGFICFPPPPMAPEKGSICPPPLDSLPSCLGTSASASSTPLDGVRAHQVVGLENLQDCTMGIYALVHLLGGLGGGQLLLLGQLLLVGESRVGGSGSGTRRQRGPGRHLRCRMHAKLYAQQHRQWYHLWCSPGMHQPLLLPLACSQVCRHTKYWETGMGNGLDKAAPREIKR